jgi:hypothetical protein
LQEYQVQSCRQRKSLTMTLERSALRDQANLHNRLTCKLYLAGFVASRVEQASE